MSTLECIKDTFLKFKPHKSRKPGVIVKKGQKVDVEDYCSRMYLIQYESQGVLFVGWSPKKYFK